MQVQRWPIAALIIGMLVAGGGATPRPPGETLGADDPFSATAPIATVGSSTVYPVTAALAERFHNEGSASAISIEVLGTSAGFERFCQFGEAAIVNASRAITRDEWRACTAQGRTPLELPIGTDALVIAVSSANTFLHDLSPDQLAAIFQGDVQRWVQLDPQYPDQPIARWSPGVRSGTFDYFVSTVLKGDADALVATAPQFSEDDTVLVRGVAEDPYAIGYFGAAYAHAPASGVRPVAISGILPTTHTVADRTYPLSRPLFVYTAEEILAEQSHVGVFLSFYLTHVSEEIGAVGYFPASAATISRAQERLRQVREAPARR